MPPFRKNGPTPYDNDVIPYVERPFPKPMSSDAFIGLPGKIVALISPDRKHHVKRC